MTNARSTAVIVVGLILSGSALAQGGFLDGYNRQREANQLETMRNIQIIQQMQQMQVMEQQRQAIQQQMEQQRQLEEQQRQLQEQRRQLDAQRIQLQRPQAPFCAGCAIVQ